MRLNLRSILENMSGVGVMKSFWMAVLALLSFGQVVAAQGEDQVLALVGGRLIDGFGGKPLENSVILVRGNRIVSIGQEGLLAVPAGARVIDTNGMTVMPGLIDVHVHFDILGHSDYPYWFPAYESQMRDVIMPTAARIILQAGVTSVRDLGADFDNIMWFRDEVNSGRIEGPRVFVAGPFLRKTVTSFVTGDYSDTWVVDGPEDAREKVRRLAEIGVDLIKTQDEGLSFDELQAIYDEAHKQGKRVASHIYSQPGIRRALQAGLGRLDTIEHIGDGMEPEYPSDIVQMILDQKVAMAPTIIAIDGFYQMTVFPELLDHPDWKASLPADIWQDVNRSYDNFQRHPLYSRAIFERKARFSKLRQLYEAGAQFVLSTDSGTRGNPHHMAAWREMVLMREVGLKPMEVILAATVVGARVLGRGQELGTIADGKLADIIVIDGDPLRNMADMRNVRHVIRDGEVIR